MTISWGYVQDASGEWMLSAEPIVAEPAKPIPELPAECWQDRKPDPDTCMAAVIAMCRAGAIFNQGAK